MAAFRSLRLPDARKLAPLRQALGVGGLVVMWRATLKIITLVAVLGGGSSSLASEQQSITAHGWGAVTVGMTLAEAEAAIEESLVETDPGLDGCFYVEPVSRPGVEFMVFVDVIVRIESTSSNVGESSGLRIGDPISKIIAVFGKEVRVTPNHYLDGWRDVFIPDVSGKYGLLFEVDENDRVVGIRGGDRRYVGMVERCA